MHEAATHLSTMELEQILRDVLQSPREAGRLNTIVVRPAADERRTLSEAKLTLEGGIDGDRWRCESYYLLPDGAPDPRCQVSLINSRLLRHIAVDPDAMCLAGDNLIVDFDLGEENSPSGSHIAIGADVIIELSDLPHTGCGKFARRFGDDARTFVNLKARKPLQLRGRYGQIVRGGTIRAGDVVSKLPIALKST